MLFAIGMGVGVGESSDCGALQVSTKSISPATKDIGRIGARRLAGCSIATETRNTVGLLSG